MAGTSQASTEAGLIFVSIASYRDRLLVPTVRDCLEKARNPERLRFGICWQHASDEELPDWFRGEHFRVLDVDYRESRGVCWARAKIMELWDGEEWFLQLDSHHLFVPDWDAVLLDQAACIDSDRFVLTSYAPPFAASEPEPTERRPTSMQFKEFTRDGILVMKAVYITDGEQRTRPQRARFVAAHFLFAPGSFVRDVPYDPELYFIGEEITLAVRAFTHGYDLFEPSRVILWHEVTYAYGRRRHWDDHPGDGGSAWQERDAASLAKVRRLFDEHEFARFGLGTERTLEQYEAYAGISFRHRKVQDYTLHNLEPPNPPAAKNWFEQVRKRRLAITVHRSQLPAKAVDDALFWYVGVHDHEGRQLHRRDVDPAELEQRVRSQPITVTVEFESEADPARWTVIPHSKSEGWLPALAGTIDGTTCADLHSRRPARVPGITWRSAGDRHIASLPGDVPRRHEFNSSGALLIELADGRHSIREIATYLRLVHQLVDDPVSEIFHFYESARFAGLITVADHDEIRRWDQEN